MKTGYCKSRREVLQKLALLPLLGRLPYNVPSELKRRTGKELKPGFVPVMITPFNQDRSIDWYSFDQLTEFYAAAGAAGYFANCLSSEMYFLSPEERLAVTERVIQYGTQQKPVVSTGSFGETIAAKAEFIKRMNGLGTDAVILITGHLALKTEGDEVFTGNLKKLLSLTENIPLGTYECPNPYKRILSPAIIELMADSKRFFYHKDTSENISGIAAKLEKAKDSSLKLYNAHTASAVASLKLGAAGLSPISGNFYPEIISWLCEHATDPAKKENVDWIQSEIATAEPLISKGYPGGAKYFLSKRGLALAPFCRSTKNTPTPEQQTTIDQVYSRFESWCERLEIEPVTF